MKRKYLISFLDNYRNPSREHQSVADSIEALEKELDFLEKNSNIYNIKITIFHE